MSFREISVFDIKENIFNLISKDWMIITSGNQSSFNCMTASWGTFGELWSKKIAICFIRPQRHTYKFINEHSFFSLSFFEEKYRNALNICGSISGKNTDKVKAAGLSAHFEGDHIFFEEAKLVMLCEKIYSDDLDPTKFLDKNIENFYQEKDYHRMFIGEIINVFIKE